MFHLNGTDYLLAADYYTKYVILPKLGHTTGIIIQTLKQIFAEHGITSKLVTDDGPQFSAETFARFSQQWSLKPRHNLTLIPQIQRLH
ncbi:hypothetical protein ACOMHN_039419 [Nucella lapillus]